ncbi:PIG-L deacetylase family protein [Kaistella carnis]|uniref:PIG-L family deacetylase n=1 Tax=Kaistella carnis TaxID=1241979 RepID=A0A3G8XI60_9FLAO|nr:PIG-L deacetylase family protein [Kaistella carnis]AZI32408.1 PIG-L family deacetylase [Kaistella carnis]
MDQIKIENIPVAPEHCVMGLGTTLIVAPHADDESLACGGVISLLRKYNQTVYILLLSDGTLSHPNSVEYPAEKLRNLRENELLTAARALDVPVENIIFCRYKDRQVPGLQNPHFDQALSNMNKIIEIIGPQSIFVPWRKDPHPDHIAAYELIDNAATNGAKIYEYAVWLNAIASAADFPSLNEIIPFKLDISSVLTKKQNAISAHQSQISDLITDDPEGFKLSPEMLAHFNQPYELFYISK